MRMSDIARHFDREAAYDGYTSALAFKCQFSSFDDSAGDGSTNRRRGMSTAPGVVIPRRRVIRLGSQRWIVGEPTDDSFLGHEMRRNYNLKRATHLIEVLTPLQACQGTAGTKVYVQLYYFKDTANALSDSDNDTFWNVFSAPSEALARGVFLRDSNGGLFRVRNDYPVAEGFGVAQTDELDSDARQAAVFSTGAYDPVADSYAAGTAPLDVIQFEPSKYYRFRTAGENLIRPGDRMVVVPNTVSVKPGVGFTMAGKSWQVAMAEPATGVTMCLSRLQ